ncbi:MAG TPA: YetF domain-containing protein [Acidimicrobiia bacterium]|nr:YetF domain-containing protein [Acidimicrobiia bacterium]
MPTVAAAGSSSPGTLLVVAGSTAGIYFFLILLLRFFGRRQLAQLSALDLVVVLLLGSAVETAMIHGDLSLAAGLVSAATLLILNRLLTVVFLRVPTLSHLVNGGPILLVHDGTIIEEHLRRVGLTLPDLDAALRGRGFASTTGVRECVLETDGSITAVGERDAQSPRRDGSGR